ARVVRDRRRGARLPGGVAISLARGGHAVPSRSARAAEPRHPRGADAGHRIGALRRTAAGDHDGGRPESAAGQGWPCDDTSARGGANPAPVAVAVAAVALSVVLLSAAGIHAMTSFTVARRRREIGIRTALGAQPRRILASVYSRVAGQLAAGAV